MKREPSLWDLHTDAGHVTHHRDDSTPVTSASSERPPTGGFPPIALRTRTLARPAPLGEAVGMRVTRRQRSVAEATSGGAAFPRGRGLASRLMARARLARWRVPFVRALRSARGITGLETAIILIAFVVVASVFAYAVLSAGIFSAERGQEAVHVGIDRAASSIDLVGSMKADGVTATVLTTADSTASWTASGNVTIASETDDRKEGTASIRLTVAGAFTTGLIASEDLGSTVDLSGHYAAGLWIKSDTTLASGVLKLVLDDSAGCGSPEESLDVGALTAATWVKVHRNVSDASALTAVACTGLSAAVDPGPIVLLIDLIEGPPEIQKVYLALTSALPTQGVTFIPQIDSNGDGLLSDEAGQANVLVISYMDSTQLVRDLAWSTNELGRGDGDVELEFGETFLLTVELRGVDPVPTAGTVMAFHIAPHEEASLVLEKVAPVNITTSMILY